MCGAGSLPALQTELVKVAHVLEAADRLDDLVGIAKLLRLLIGSDDHLFEQPARALRILVAQPDPQVDEVGALRIAPEQREQRLVGLGLSVAIVSTWIVLRSHWSPPVRW